MNTHALSRAGLQVPRSLGANVFGCTADEATSIRLLDTWVDAGMNFIDTTDLYQSHDDHPRVPRAKTAGARAALIQSGKVRPIGASNFSAAQLSEALAVNAAHGPGMLAALDAVAICSTDRASLKPE